MTEASEPDELPLSDALTRWTDPRLVTCVRTEERRHTPASLRDYYRGNTQQLQLCADDQLRVPRASEGWVGPPDTGKLLSAWRALERDLRLRIERGDFHLRGVCVAPRRERTRSVIESAWATDFEFDFYAGRVGVGDEAYVAVVAIRGPALLTMDEALAAPQPSVHSPAITQITQEIVRDLSDDEVLLLLEEHARRAVENTEFKALDPGITKVSFMPLILRKMRARSAAGALLDSLGDEAAALENWIQQKAPSHQTPTAGAIRNSLRNDYHRLKA
jgi:hypothetical protein